MTNKTTTIKGIATIDNIGTSCQKGMPWETTYINFRVYPDETSEKFTIVRWHSENIDDTLKKQDKIDFYRLQEHKDTWLDFEALCRPAGGGEYQVWRIKNIEYR